MNTKSLDPVDLINMKLEQLTALLNVGMCEDFTTYSDKIQIGYLWACSSLADEIKTTFQHLDNQGKVRA
ncbi:MAG: hypothetical protein E6Q83_16440 [Thiothrix sp.]|nr:MAG: hypothetical protein E6Q83_16440 [Thiothrix sp.]